MSPSDCDVLIAKTVAKFDQICPTDFIFDKIIYWKIIIKKKKK